MPNLDFSNGIPTNPTGYKVIFIDSVDDAKLSPEAIKAFIDRNRSKGIATIGIHHTTKAGALRGSMSFAHNVDTLIEVGGGMASGKGRFAALYEMPLTTLIGSYTMYLFNTK